MALGSQAILDAIASYAMQGGYFERVNQHEPKNAPGNGLSCAIWVQSVEPTRSSGLAATSVRMVFNIRLYSSMLQEPQDAIDPNILAALDDLIETFNDELTLGGAVRTVDVFGMAGISLGAQAGYINQDGKLYRVMTITLPVIVNDVWSQNE